MDGDNIDIFDIDIGDYFGNEALNSINKKETEHSDICLECGNSNFIEDYSQGYIVCEDCGRVADNLLDANPEWKTYDDNTTKDSGRCGKIVNQLLPRSSIGTSVNAYGRIKMIHNWSSMPYKERSLNYVFKKLRAKCQEHNIPKKIEDDAQIMYKMVSERKHTSGKNKGKYIITRGINRGGIIAASLFYACRRNGVTRSPKEVAKMFDLNETDLNKGAKNFLRLIKMKYYDKNMGTSKPIDFVRRKCDDLNIKSKYTTQAINIAENIDKLNIASTHTSYSLAAASILLMGEINKLSSITKKKLAAAFEVSDVTITKAYKKIYAYKNVLANDKTVNKIIKKMKEDERKHVISKELYERMKKFKISTKGYKVEGESDSDDDYDDKTENEIIIMEESSKDSNNSDDFDEDSFDTDTCVESIANSLALLKKFKKATPDYFEIIDDIEDELNYSAVTDDEVARMKAEMGIH